MNSKISTIEWVCVLVFAALVDVIQLILNLFAIGLIINRIIDIVMGILLPVYYWLRGVSFNSTRLFSIIGATGLEFIPVVDSLPLWSLEVIVVWSSLIVEKKISQKPILGKVVKVMNKVAQPLNKNGVRLPTKKSPATTNIPPRLPRRA